MAEEPALHQMRGHVGLKRVYAIRVTKPFRTGWRAGDAGGCHDFLNATPRGCAAPAPNPFCRKLRVALPNAQIKNSIKFNEQLIRQRNLSHNAAPPAFERLPADNAASAIMAAVNPRSPTLGD